MADTRIPNSILRTFVYERIEKGELPVLACKTFAAGYGSNNNCAVCGRPIAPEETAYATQTESLGDLAFHCNCYVAWQAECADRMLPKSAV